MTINGWTQIALFCAIIIALTRPFGGYMTRVFAGERTLLHPVLRPVERAIYCLLRRRRERGAALAHLRGRRCCSSASRVRRRSTRCSGCRACLPFNPQGQSAVEESLAFNTSVSFVTNTNWQSYAPETTMSYLTQMAGLTVHNFVSAATGIALAIALVRGFARREAKTIGNFWVDLTRCTLYILLPISIVIALCLRVAGHAAESRAPMSTRRRSKAPSRRSRRVRSPRRKSIKIFGTNGGGFFNANSAHPYENPTALTNSHSARADLLDRRRPHQCPGPHGARTSARAGRSSPPWGFCSWPASPRPIGPKSHGNPAFARSASTQRAERAAGRRQHGRQGGPLRHRQFGALRHRHHRHLLRRGQLHA